MLTWQIAEYSSLPYVLFKVLAANSRQAALREDKIAFGAHPQQHSWLCLPDQATATKNSLVFFAHGGGWRMGNPGQFRFIGHFFALLGFPTVLAGYRLAPGFQFPAQMQDIYAGFEAGLQAVRERGVQVERVIVGGQSAGAQLTAVLAYDRAGLSSHHLNQEFLAGFFAISGPLDFSACNNSTAQRMIWDYVGNRPNWEKADPIRHIRGGETLPVLCIHGDQDPLLAIQNARSFVSRLKQSETCQAELHIVRGGHHSDLITLFTDNTLAAQVLAKWLTARGD